MLICLGEPPVRFLCCCCLFLMCIFICWCSSFCCCSSFIFRLLYNVTRTPPWLLRPVKASSSSELYPRLLLIAFSFSSSTSATASSGHFLHIGVFYLTLLPDIFGATCFYQGFPGSQQLFLEICRASYWSSKHRAAVCLIHSNPQSFIHLKFVLTHVNIAKVLLVVKTLIKNIDQQPHYSPAISFK